MRSQIGLMGKKEGMIHVFDEDGNLVACSVIRVNSNVVTQIKTVSRDGYAALQLGAGEVVASEKALRRRFTKPELGHLKKSGDRIFSELKELYAAKEDVENVSLGDSFDLDVLDGVSFVDVVGVSKGKGFQGVMKKFGFRGGPAGHGSGFHRHAGSIGMRSTPGRCFPGSKRPSHMGCDRVTVKNLRVVKIDKERNVLLVKGAVPGSRGDVLVVRCAAKGRA